MDQGERSLILLAQHGDLGAFEQLVARHDRQVLKLAYDLLNNEEDAQDAYQEIFLQVHRKLRSFRFESGFSTWLYRVVVNYCINFRKRRSRNRFHFKDIATENGAVDPLEQIEDKSEDPEHAVINQELGQRISAAMDGLSEQQRAVFVLRHFHGHKLHEIAAILKCAEGTVKNYLFRATRHMQEQLRAYHEDRL